MQLETISEPFRRARSVNQTSATFVSKVPTGTEPLGDAGTATGARIIELTGTPPGSFAQNGIFICPYGIGANDTTFSLRVIGWRKIGRDPNLSLWIPVTLIEVLCTLGLSTGVAGRDVLDTESFADIIAVTVGSTLSGEAAAENIVSPANDTIASLLVDLKGSQKVELTFSTGSSATSCNALLAFM